MDLDRQSWGRTALHLAVQVKSLDMARILVEHGASSQIVDRQNETPHHVAASNRQILILQLLFVNDPDPVVRDYFLKTPIDEYDSPEAKPSLSPRGEGWDIIWLFCFGSIQAHRTTWTTTQRCLPKEN